MEGDDKHVKKLEEEWDMSHCNPVGTPYVKPTSCIPAEGGEVEGTTPLGPVETTLFRRAAARINYIALDRPDLSFASRVAASMMGCPKVGSDIIIKRIIRYLKGRPRVAIRYRFQEPSENLIVFTDSEEAPAEE